MRAHPVVGSMFFLASLGLFVLGATAHSAPRFLTRAPLPPEVLVPFVLWQLAVWAALFGAFFWRERTRGGRRRHARPAVRI